MDASSLPAVLAVAAVARHGSFTRAASAAGMSTSALSQSVRALEVRLGVRLFNRTTRRVVLTEAGAQFLARVQPALAEIDAAFDALDETRGLPAGTLRINLSRIASELLVMPHVSEFLQRYPQIRLELALDDGFADLVGEGFDAGIRLGESLAPGMVAVALGGPIRLVVVGSPDYFASHPPPATPDDLAAHDCLHYGFATGGVYRWEFVRPEEPQRVFDVITQGRLVTNDLRTMVQAAERGVGLLHVIDDYVRAQLDEGRLVPVLQMWCPSFPGFYLYTAGRAQMPAKLRALIDFLREKRGTAQVSG
ncbi:LysR family transcriptional regulator [Paraburkholderia sp. MMS20-SJTN17]|uniref:LysR family transcriptional regulator n=1 Tax=Paraburkholderia translucens TaxID=2886945 RepID=A0ABS8KAJ9_9BURK|nr:LysR family transcriptional regulator [Paraburkholderia sp. MMS20-SJTN17]MCC8401483.1 LysR family transcriptional regulator [Paraburkholderia sp. MMS20-SJTN17]